MRLLIFSDTHLTNKFEQKKYEYLKNIIEGVDQVVINGDFWDGYIISFSDFVASEWSGLFPLLRKKKATYLFGNHDKQEFSDERTSLFSVDQQTSLSIKTRKHNLLIEHGNRLLPFVDEKLNRRQIPSVFAQQALDVDRFLFTNFGTVLVDKLYKNCNENIKKEVRKQIDANQVYVCGHTHLAEVDLSNRFINSGVIAYGVAQYIVIENEDVELVEYWYDKPLIESFIDPDLYLDYTLEL